MTTTLYQIIQSELIKKGFNEFIDDDGNLVLFDKEYQFIQKILSFDDDILELTNELFMDMSLENKERDEHFKRTFLTNFINRQINRQTVESFKLVLLSTFMMYKDFINTVYSDIEKYMTQSQTTDNQNIQTNSQTNDSSQTTDNRNAFADLPQNKVNLDVDNSVMEYASDNTITKNKQKNTQQTDGETIGNTSGESKSYQFDELIKSSNLMEQVLNNFDKKCFMQVW